MYELLFGFYICQKFESWGGAARGKWLASVFKNMNAAFVQNSYVHFSYAEKTFLNQLIKVFLNWWKLYSTSQHWRKLLSCNVKRAIFRKPRFELDTLWYRWHVKVFVTISKKIDQLLYLSTSTHESLPKTRVVTKRCDTATEAVQEKRGSFGLEQSQLARQTSRLDLCSLLDGVGWESILISTLFTKEEYLIVLSLAADWAYKYLSRE